MKFNIKASLPITFATFGCKVTVFFDIYARNNILLSPLSGFFVKKSGIHGDGFYIPDDGGGSPRHRASVRVPEERVPEKRAIRDIESYRFVIRIYIPKGGGVRRRLFLGVLRY